MRKTTVSDANPNPLKLDHIRCLPVLLGNNPNLEENKHAQMTQTFFKSTSSASGLCNEDIAKRVTFASYAEVEHTLG